MSLLDWLRTPTPPPAAVAIAADHVAAALVEVRAGRPVVVAHALEPLAPGAVVASLTAANIADRAAVIGALGRLFDRLGSRPRRVGLVIPDPAAKVSLVRFEHVPARRQDLEQLIRWQMRKAAPFPIDQAQVGCADGGRTPDGYEFIVTIARREVIEEYEQVCAEVGAYPGLVDLATFNVVNAVLGGSPPAGDWLFVNAAVDYASIAILRDRQLLFYRNRASDTDGAFLDLVHQSAMYYEDRLGGAGFSRVLLAGGAHVPRGGPMDIRRSLEERLGRTVDAVDPRTAAALTDRITANPMLLEALAPLVGLLVRGQEAA